MRRAAALLRLLRSGASAGVRGRPACAAVHPLAVKSGSGSDARVATALADAYAKSGLVDRARRVFDETPLRDQVVWNVMVSCYSSHGLVRECWDVFGSMRRSGFPGDGFTFSALLSVRASSSSCYDHANLLLVLGSSVHGIVIRLGLHLDVVVATALLDMYAKCGQVAEASRVFDAMVLRNTVSWNAIIVCYGKHDRGKEAFDLFVSMMRHGFCPDELTLASLLSSCADMAAANEATQLHAYTVRRGLQDFLQVGNALIMAYGKNGFVQEAKRTFGMIHNPDLVTWSSMVSSFAYLGLSKSAIDLFDRMLQQGIRADGIAFLGVLSACSHAGLIEDGFKYFLLMTRDYKIDPTPQHLACLVDLLGRAGRIRDAYEFLVNMSCDANVDVIGAFLGACRMRGNIESAKWAASRLFSLKPDDPINYLLISNTYAAAGDWNELAKVRSVMRNMCGNKVPGCSWIEIGGIVQTFVSNDMMLHQSREMQRMMELLVSLVEQDCNGDDTICNDPSSILKWQDFYLEFD
uniref:Pentatricopeptide n=1 Tax=Oryza glumipatula TaxID=40148 RepID=G8JBD9_9ORYZ|nr:pentatricopeptide [Oryza glumipatula]